MLIPGTCKCYLGKKIFAGVTKLRILRWGGIPGLSRSSLNANTRVLVRGGQRKITDRGGEANVATEAENGVMGPRGKGYCQPLDAGRGQDPIPPQGLQCPCPHLDFGPMILNSDSWPPDCQRTHFCCSKRQVCGGVQQPRKSMQIGKGKACLEKGMVQGICWELD